MKKILLFAFAAVFSLTKTNAQTPITCAAAHTQQTGTATVTGIILNGSELGTTTRYIQDATGGLALYSGTALSGVNRGDSIKVSGTLSTFSGLLELGTLTINSTSSGHSLPAANVISAATGFTIANEGTLVRLNGVTFSATGTFSGNANYTFTQGSTTEDIRINNASNLVGTAIPSGTVDIVGILSENASSGGATVFQLLPRDLNDIIYPGNPPILTTGLVQKNITQTSFSVNFNTQLNGTTIIKYGLTPTALTQTVNSATMTTVHSQNLTGLTPATIYYVQGLSVSSTNDTSKSLVTAMATESNSSGRIKVYFNNPIDATKAQHGNVAQYLNNTFDDTLIAFINSAQSTLDVTIYNVDNNLNVITALNNAYNNGITLRVICDSNNTSVSNYNLINTPNKSWSHNHSSQSAIMHNKFIVKDVSSPTLAEVWTGSTNWTQQQLTSDRNNIITIQDQSLARGYTVEFEEMYSGGKYGTNKGDNTPHEYIIGGKRIEQYFSPTDNVGGKIKTALASANYDVYTGVYAYTKTDVAYTIYDSAFKSNNAYVAGIIDDVTDTAVAKIYNKIRANASLFYTGSGLFHHKYGIIDPNDACSDPMVITGSANWSNGGFGANDENVLIVHDSTIANLYYQEFAQRFTDEGHTVQNMAYKTCGGGGTIGINEINPAITAQLFPNPSQENTTLLLNENAGSKGWVSICDITGKELMHINFNNQSKIEIAANNLNNGIYLVNVNTEKGKRTLKWVLSK